MSIQTLKLSDITVSDRLRLVDEDWAQAIAQSIILNGLIEPLIVRPLQGKSYMLVAGAHRYRGLELAQIDEAECKILEITEAQARLVEIDENLMRQELGALDRAVFLAERKTIYEEIHPETKKGGDHTSDDATSKAQTLRLATFTEEIAEKIGLSQRTIQDAITLVDRLSPHAISDLRGTPFGNNAAQLKALSRLTPSEQISVAKMLIHDEVKAVAEGKAKLSGMPPKPELSPRDAWLKKIKNLYFQGDKRDRKAFLKEIGAALK